MKPTCRGATDKYFWHHQFLILAGYRECCPDCFTGAFRMYVHRCNLSTPVRSLQNESKCFCVSSVNQFCSC